jgi:hypothetical protein
VSGACRRILGKETKLGRCILGKEAALERAARLELEEMGKLL